MNFESLASKKKIFRDYAEVDCRELVGYIIGNVSVGINSEETGLLIELEKTINGGVIGIDIRYDPSREAKDLPLSISEEYIKYAFKD